MLMVGIYFATNILEDNLAISIKNLKYVRMIKIRILVTSRRVIGWEGAQGSHLGCWEGSTS